MKLKTIMILAVFFVSQWACGQIYHIHWNNRDYKTRAKLTTLISTLMVRQTNLTATNAMLATAIINHRTQLQRNYTRNQFDRQDDFLSNSVGSAALGLASVVLSKYPSLPYMSSSKKQYYEQIALDKSMLLSLQYVDASKIKSANRQRIYRLRSELIRQFSKNDKEARKGLMLSMGAMVILNPEIYSELKELLNSTTISL